MIDVELVIRIPNETYQDVVKNGFIYDEDRDVISHAIINGIPLSKVHGRKMMNKVDCNSTECKNCTNHNYCDYETQTGKERKYERI